MPTPAAGLLALSGALLPRAVAAWDDLRPVSEPATPPPAPVAPPTDIGSLFTPELFLKLGFSFMVGLAVGYALKIAFKIALAAIGVILIGVFALQYAGVVQVDWSSLELRYDGWADWLSVNGRAFLDFMGRNLSNVASFFAGMALGLRL